jgi:penicillin-binding protein 1A
MMIGKNLNDSLDRLAAVTKSAGIQSDVRQFPAAFLGSSEMTLMEMTLANTMFPSNGIRPVKPFIIERIEEKSGKVIFQEKPMRVRAIKPTTAYEIHSCLSQVLDRGTADKTFTELGLKRADLGGKTGTAYNFTDVWFLGYSSEVSCGIWAGFDKPRTPIYRGAFSNEIALPIWTKVMQTADTTYKPQEIRPPQGIEKVKICTETGLLATDKCFETTENKETGEKIRRSTTTLEICTAEQAPKSLCDLHGDVPRSFVKDDPRNNGKVPRAVPVKQETTNTPVAMKAPTVVGLDPYNSSKALESVAAISKLETGHQAPIGNDGQVEPVQEGPEVQVRKAEPVKPLEQTPSIESSIKIEPPKPIEF